MRYIDSGGNDPAQTLGAWMRDEVEAGVNAIRWQTGYFGADGIGFLLPVLPSVPTFVGVIGSNGGETLGSDVHRLVGALRLPRAGVRLGIVTVGGALFHPKVFHFTRRDGSATAYVGSANLSARGVSGANVEAGIIIDQRSGDDAETLAVLSNAIESWFDGARPGMVGLRDGMHVDELITSGLLSITRPPRLSVVASALSGGGPRIPSRKALVSLPSVPLWRGEAESIAALLSHSYTPSLPTAPSSAALIGSASAEPQPPVVVVERWAKLLSASDAQRKRTGNQRGSVTLTKSDHPIEAATYFRHVLFANERWVEDYTATNKRLEKSKIAFNVLFLGARLGVLDLEVSFAADREASQSNYTSLLHLGPLAERFAKSDVTNKVLELVRLSDGSYTLSILDTRAR